MEFKKADSCKIQKSAFSSLAPFFNVLDIGSTLLKSPPFFLAFYFNYLILFITISYFFIITYFNLHISLLYSSMVLSDEKNPALAILTKTFLFHDSLSS